MDINRPNSPNSFMPLFKSSRTSSTQNNSSSISNNIEIANNGTVSTYPDSGSASRILLDSSNNDSDDDTNFKANSTGKFDKKNNENDSSVVDGLENAINCVPIIEKNYILCTNGEEGYKAAAKIISVPSAANHHIEVTVKSFSGQADENRSTKGGKEERRIKDLLDLSDKHEYVNNTYTDTSRRSSTLSEQANLLLDSNSLGEGGGTNEDVAQPLLSSFGNTQGKPKSIVKSSSANSFKCNSNRSDDKSSQHSLSLRHCSILENFSNIERPSIESSERPVLHVQFVPHDIVNFDEDSSHYGNNNVKRKLESKSPIGSISSETTKLSSSNSSSSSDDDASSEYSEARAPDGGWGWVVVFASFIVNLIADGVTFSFGVIFVEFLNYFGKSKGKTAWIGSLFFAVPLLSGPISSYLTDRYGCRKVTILGSILACIGFVISSFTDSIEMLFFTFGILAGFGLSLCYVAAVVIVAYYFEKKRSFATGLSVCGSGIGTFIFAPLIQWLLAEYGWRGTTLILAGIFLNMCVCGMLMRDLDWTTHRAKKKAKERKGNKMVISADSFSVSNSTYTGGTASNLNQHGILTDGLAIDFTGIDTNGVKSEELDDPRLFSSLIALPTFIRNGERIPLEVIEHLSTNRNVQNLLMQNYPGLLHSRTFSEPLSSKITMSPELQVSPNANDPVSFAIPTTSGSQKHSNVEKFQNEQALLAWIKKNHSRNHHSHKNHPSDAYLKDLRMHRHSLTYRGAMLNINRYRLRASSCPDIYRNSMTTIAKEKSAAEFKNLFLDILDFSYFADIRFSLFALSNFLLYTWYDVPYVYLTDNAIELGIEESDASMLIAIIGIVNMFGEIALGWIGDVKGISASVVYGVCIALCGAVTAAIPLSSSYTWLSGVAGLFGLFIAANYALTSIILVEIISLDRFTNAYGLLLLVQGIANLVGPPFAGWIYDVTGTYDLSFYISGFFIFISGLMLIILPALGTYRKYRALRRQTEVPKIPSNEQERSHPSPTKKCNGTKLINDCLNQKKLKDTIEPNQV